VYHLFTARRVITFVGRRGPFVYFLNISIHRIIHILMPFGLGKNDDASIQPLDNNDLNEIKKIQEMFP
jgi:hypothetical protein